MRERIMLEIHQLDSLCSVWHHWLHLSLNDFLSLNCTCRFEEAVKHYTVNVSQEMLRIKEELERKDDVGSTETVARKEELLEELLEIVENIDNAKGIAKAYVKAALSIIDHPERCRYFQIELPGGGSLHTLYHWLSNHRAPKAIPWLLLWGIHKSFQTLSKGSWTQL